MKINLYEYWKCLCGIFLLIGLFFSEHSIITHNLLYVGIGGGSSSLILDFVIHLKNKKEEK